MLRLCQIWSILLGFALVGMTVSARADIDPVTGAVGGDAAAQSFAEYCQRAASTAVRMEKFYAELDQADRAIATGNQTVAEAALQNALLAVSPGGSFDDTAIRCRGERATRRWFTTRLEIWRRGWGSGPDGSSGDYTGTYVSAADGGTDGLVKNILSGPAKRFASNYRTVDEIARRTEWQQSFGTLLLTEEIAIAKSCRDALGPLQDYARSENLKTLAAEDVAFNRPATQTEQDAAAALGGIVEMSGAISGLDIGGPDQREIMLAQPRVNESVELLNTASGLEIEAVFGDSNARTPSRIRAEKRGDTLLARANRKDANLEARDTYYSLALRYLRLCNCRDKAAAAAKDQEAIQPALQAKAERQRQKLDAMAAEMQQQAEGSQAAIDDMKKTEAEKQSFKDEADALEAELDF